MTTIGYATLQIIPSLDGVSEAVDKQLGGSMLASGKKGGKQLAKGVGEGLKDLEREVESAAKSYDKLKDKAADALGKVRKEEATLQDLRDKGITSGSRWVAAEERLATARRNSNRANREAEDGHKGLANAQKRLGDSSNDLGGKLGKLSGLAGVAGTALAGAGVIAAGAATVGIAALAAGVVLAGKALYDLGGEFDDTFDNIRIKTGATGEAMAALQDQTRRLSGVIALPIGEIGDVVAETNRHLHLTGVEADNVARSIADAGRMTGQAIDVKELGKVFRAFKIDGKDQVAVLDEIWGASQSTGLGINELVTTLGKGGASLRAMNLDVGESAAVLGMLEAASLDSDTAMKGFTAAAKYLAKEGLTLEDGLAGVSNEIKNLDDAAALDLANKVFGGKQGEKFAEKIRDSSLDLVGLDAAIAGTGDTIAAAAADTDDWSEKWQLFQNKLKVGLEPVGTAVFDTINGELTELSDWVLNHQDEVIRFFGAVGEKAIEGLGGILTFASEALRAVAGTLEGFDSMLGPLFDVDTSFLTDAADKIDLMGAKLPEVAAGWNSFIDRAAEAQTLVQGVGDATIALNETTGNVEISSNAPEVQESLRAIGVKIEEVHNQDGSVTFVVTGDTSEGERVIAAWKQQKEGAPLNIPIRVDTTGATLDVDNWADALANRGPVMIPTATVPGQPGAPTSANPFAGYDGGGYTGNLPLSEIAGVVHGDEWVIKSPSRRRIEADHPGLLDHMNATGRLPGYQDGGLVDGGLADLAKQFAVSMDPAKYEIGGFSPSAFDCSGLVSAVANVATGRDPFSSRMSTVTEGAWLKSLGFKTGSGGAGDLRVGWWDKGGGKNGHTAGTFPDGTNFESSSNGVVIGGSTGAGADQFTNHAYLPAELLGGGISDPKSAAQIGLGQGKAAAATAQAGGETPEAASGGGGSGSGGFGLPSSFSEFGSAIGEFAGGQIGSALDVFGIPDSPGWLQGASQLLGGISVSDSSGNSLFDGGNLFGGGQGGGGSTAPPAVPASAVTPWATPDAGIETTHGTRAGQAPGPVYNIRTATVEDAFLQARRKENERAAAKVARF